MLMIATVRTENSSMHVVKQLLINTQVLWVITLLFAVYQCGTFL